MARNGKHTKTDLMANSVLGPYAKKPSSTQSLQDQIMETKLRSEQAKLSLLKAKLPDEGPPKYTRWEDMPPPTPEDEARFFTRFRKLVGDIKLEGIGPEDGQTVQDWLRDQGAVIPDLPEWKVPLYLEKF